MEDNDKNGVQVLNRRRSERSEKCGKIGREIAEEDAQALPPIRRVEA
jgi:hypothetical protein